MPKREHKNMKWLTFYTFPKHPYNAKRQIWKIQNTSPNYLTNTIQQGTWSSTLTSGEEFIIIISVLICIRQNKLLWIFWAKTVSCPWCTYEGKSLLCIEESLYVGMQRRFFNKLRKMRVISSKHNAFLTKITELNLMLYGFWVWQP